MKKKTIILSAILTAAMMTAPMSVFAGDPAAQDTTINQTSTDKSGAMTATYSVSPSYTVTIPASVVLSSTQDVTATISTGTVMLEEGKCVEVKLKEAQNTQTGNTFHAEVGNSIASYTIKDKAEKQVSVGDVVAKFGTSTDPQTSVLTFSAATGATYAGTHTETLTFSLAVVDSGSTVMIGDNSYTYTPGQTFADLAEANGWVMEFSDIYSDQYKIYQLYCGDVSVSADDPIDGSKTYEWVDIMP